jgi:hypothetical protein
MIRSYKIIKAFMFTRNRFISVTKTEKKEKKKLGNKSIPKIKTSHIT